MRRLVGDAKNKAFKAEKERRKALRLASQPPLPLPLEMAAPIPYQENAAPSPQIIYVVEKRKTTPTTWGCLIIIVLFALIGITSKTLSGPDVYGDSSAYMAGQEFVKRNLKNPAAATFDRLNSDECFHYQRSDGQFEVGGTVRSTNSFGGIVPTRWKCVVKHNGGGHFSMIYLKLGDQETGNYPKDNEQASRTVEASNTDQDLGRQFIGLTKERLIEK